MYKNYTGFSFSYFLYFNFKDSRKKKSTYNEIYKFKMG